MLLNTLPRIVYEKMLTVEEYALNFKCLKFLSKLGTLPFEVNCKKGTLTVSESRWKQFSPWLTAVMLLVNSILINARLLQYFLDTKIFQLHHFTAHLVIGVASLYCIFCYFAFIIQSPHVTAALFNSAFTRRPPPGPQKSRPLLNYNLQELFILCFPLSVNLIITGGFEALHVLHPESLLFTFSMVPESRRGYVLYFFCMVMDSLWVLLATTVGSFSVSLELLFFEGVYPIIDRDVLFM